MPIPILMPMSIPIPMHIPIPIPMHLHMLMHMHMHMHMLMLMHTLRSLLVAGVLMLVPPEDETCFCVGNPADPSAAGSPWASQCLDPSWGKSCGTMGGKDCCISHTQVSVGIVGIVGIGRD
jgi:hypothetical protein